MDRENPSGTERGSVTKRGWRPDPGSTVAGEVIDVSQTDGGYGPYNVLALRTEDGAEVDVHAFHTVLRNELARRDVQVGDRVEITYVGRVDGGRGTSGYDHYRVKGGKVPRIDWSGDAGGDAQAPEPDVPIDGRDLQEPPARSVAERAAETDNDGPPF